MILKMNVRIKIKRACNSCKREGNCVLTIFIVSLICYMRIIGLPRLCKLHFIHKTFREILCMCVCASYMKMTRGTNLMQQFIIINNSTYFWHLYAHLQEYSVVYVVYYGIWCSALDVAAEVLRSRCVVLCSVCGFVSCNLHNVHKTTHRLLRTSATTPSAEHHMQ
jgi:hypothetical protein